MLSRLWEVPKDIRCRACCSGKFSSNAVAWGPSLELLGGEVSGTLTDNTSRQSVLFVLTVHYASLKISTQTTRMSHFLRMLQMKQNLLPTYFLALKAASMSRMRTLGHIWKKYTSSNSLQIPPLHWRALMRLRNRSSACHLIHCVTGSHSMSRWPLASIQAHLPGSAHHKMHWENPHSGRRQTWVLKLLHHFSTASRSQCSAHVIKCTGLRHVRLWQASAVIPLYRCSKAAGSQTWGAPDVHMSGWDKQEQWCQCMGAARHQLYCAEPKVSLESIWTSKATMPCSGVPSSPTYKRRPEGVKLSPDTLHAPSSTVHSPSHASTFSTWTCHACISTDHVFDFMHLNGSLRPY